jgi:hypothetical protein
VITFRFHLSHCHWTRKDISHASSSLTETKAGQHVPPHNTEITKTGVPAEAVKKQVVEVWNHQNNKRSHGAQELRMNEQHEHMNITRTCQCREHYGRSRLQKEASLMRDEARQCYHLDINKKRKLCTQNQSQKKLLKL